MTALAHKAHWLYRCYDADGFLLYIGATSDLKQRLAYHRHPPKGCSTPSAQLAERMAYHEAEEYPDRASAFDAEALSIRREQPPLNVKHREGHRLALYSTTHKPSTRPKEITMTLERDYTLTETAALLKVSTRWIRNRIKAGVDGTGPFVEHIRRGNKIMFTAAQVEQLRMSDAQVPEPQVVESITTGRKRRA